MFFHLDLKIEEICDRDFIVKNSPVNFAQAEIFLLESSQKVLFVLKRGEPDTLYMQVSEKRKKVYSNRIVQIDLFTVVDGDQSLLNCMDLVEQYPFLLVVNKQKKPIGFVTSGMLTVLLASNFNDLRHQFLTVLEGSGEIIVITDEKLKVLYLNRKAESFYNIKKENAIGKNLESFFSTLILKDVLDSGEPVMESYHQPRLGLYVLINSLPIKVDNRLIGGVSMERDITTMVNMNKEILKANSKLNILQKEIEKIQYVGDKAFKKIYGHSPRLKEVVSMANKVAQTNAAVLIRGESGTGKELFAKAIHLASRRNDGPFIAINCGAIPPNLFESELFGYEGGAFTGADRKGKKGSFELASGGTLLLDEIGEMEYTLQVKLLRVLQENVFFRIGGSKEVKVDVRIVAATNKDLEKMVEDGSFRQDLYYRLNVVSMEIPPLRERKGDIPELVYKFINEFSLDHHKKIDDISSDLMTAFLKYDWPGNVRELRNIIERLVVLTEGPIINKEYLPPILRDKLKDQSNKEATGVLLETATQDVERSMIIKALQDVRGNKTKAAHLLGIPRSTLYYRMNKLGMDVGE
jgi:transcriptional regulator with PAS, ATPase and Fis domain